MARVCTFANHVDYAPFAKAADPLLNVLPRIAGAGTFYPLDPRDKNVILDPRLALEFAAMIMRTRTFNAHIVAHMSGSGAFPPPATTTSFVADHDGVAQAWVDYPGQRTISEWRLSNPQATVDFAFFGTSFVSQATHLITYTPAAGPPTTGDWIAIFDQFEYNTINSFNPFPYPGPNAISLLCHWNPPLFFFPIRVGLTLGDPTGGIVYMRDGQVITTLIAESAVFHRPYKTAPAGRFIFHWPKWWMNNEMEVTEIPLFACSEVLTDGGLAGSTGSRTANVEITMTIEETRHFGYDPDAPHFATDNPNHDPIWASDGRALRNPTTAHALMPIPPGINGTSF